MQELATQLNYRNLRRVAGGKCPALDRALDLIATDEAAHAQFFRKLTAYYLEEDRENTIDAFRTVANSWFATIRIVVTPSSASSTNASDRGTSRMV